MFPIEAVALDLDGTLIGSDEKIPSSVRNSVKALAVSIPVFICTGRERWSTEKFAKELVYQTAYGSIKLLLKDFNSAEKLINNISIKGGTTEAAIRHFKKNNQLKNMVNNAVKAAHKRAIELGKNNG